MWLGCLVTWLSCRHNRAWFTYNVADPGDYSTYLDQTARHLDYPGWDASVVALRQLEVEHGWFDGVLVSPLTHTIAAAAAPPPPPPGQQPTNVGLLFPDEISNLSFSDRARVPAFPWPFGPFGENNNNKTLTD